MRAGSSVLTVFGETVVKRSAVFELDFNAKQTRFERAHAVDQIGGCRRSESRHSSCRRRLLAQFGLTPKSKRGLASSDPGEGLAPLDGV